MRAGREDRENGGFVAGDGHNHVVRQDRGVQKREEPVFAGFDGRDVAGQAVQGAPQFLARFAEQPPQAGVTRAILGMRLGIPLRFDRGEQMLVDLGEAVLDLGFGEAEEIDDHDVAWFVG
jgi:hypothetical protein